VASFEYDVASNICPALPPTEDLPAAAVARAVTGVMVKADIVEVVGDARGDVSGTMVDGAVNGSLRGVSCSHVLV